MRVLPMLLALAGTASTLVGQAGNCGFGSDTVLTPQYPFGGGFFFGTPGYPAAPTPPYNGFAYFMDVQVGGQLVFTSVDLCILGQLATVGIGGGATFRHPGQLGNTTLVEFYTAPGAPGNTYVGQETADPALPGSPWILSARGILTVGAAYNPQPVTFPAFGSGAWGGNFAGMETGPLVLPASGARVPLAIVVRPVGQDPGPDKLYGTADDGVTGIGPDGTVLALNWGDPTTPWPAPWGLSPMLANQAPATNYTSDDALFDIQDHAFQRNAWNSGPISTVVQMFRFHYYPDYGVASWTQFGAGCENVSQNWYENFPEGAATFDLAGGLSIQYQAPIGVFGPRHNVSVGAGSAYVAPVSPALTMSAADDGVSGIIPLGMGPQGFRHPGGVATDVVIGGNGYFFLDAAATSASPWYDRFSTNFQLQARVMPAYCDLDDSFSGTMHFDQISPSEVRITWLNIEEWAPTLSPIPQMTFQVALYGSGHATRQNGDMDFIYVTPIQTSNGFGNSILVGYTPGFEAATAGLDISTAAPFQSGDGTTPPTLRVQGSRPIQPSNPNLRVENIKAGSSGVINAISSTGAVPGGISLGFLGAPNCSIYLPLSAPIVAITPIGGGVTSNNYTLVIPATPNVVGLRLWSQAGVLTPGYNAGLGGAGLFATNAVCLYIGNM